ncbi:hypothetical protein Plhal304r1_c021g0074151 [Plasmopara halstedii]
MKKTFHHNIFVCSTCFWHCHIWSTASPGVVSWLFEKHQGFSQNHLYQIRQSCERHLLNSTQLNAWDSSLQYDLFTLVVLTALFTTEFKRSLEQYMPTLLPSFYSANLYLMQGLPASYFGDIFC